MAGAGQTIVLIVIIVGLLLIMTARIITAVMIKVDFDDFDTLKNLTVTALILTSIGIAFISMGLFYAAIALEDLGTHVRSALAITAGIIVVFTGFVSLL